MYDDETWLLGVFYKSLGRVQMSRSKVKGQGHWGQKNEKSAAFCSGIILWGAILRQFYHAGWKISACCLVCQMLLRII